MTSIDTITKTISNLFKMARKPFPKISGYILACSLLQRPGLSTILSTANVVKALSMLGIPTGNNPDGSENLTVAYTMAIIDEVYRALKHDASISVAALPGTISFIGTGSNGGGPIVINGVNINTGELVGLAK